jgi:hypothetical protein
MLSSPPYGDGSFIVPSAGPEKATLQKFFMLIGFA